LSLTLKEHTISDIFTIYI